MSLLALIEGNRISFRSFTAKGNRSFDCARVEPFGKRNHSPRSAQDDGFLKSGLRRAALPLLVLVIVLQVGVGLWEHNSNLLSSRVRTSANFDLEDSDDLAALRGKRYGL